MSQLRRFVHEIRRRSLWQVLGIYALASWVIYQVVVALWEGIGLPEWVPGTALVLLLIGLPIVLATAFIQEGAPGLRPDDRRETVAGLETTADALAANRRAGNHAEPAGHAAAEVGERSDTTTTTTRKPRGAATLFTWRKAVTGGVLAFAALGLAATGFMGMRALGIGPAATLMTRGILEARDPIVLADFENRTGQEHLGISVTEALRVDLAESPAVRVLEPGELNEALGRMGLGPGPLDAGAAIELAVREGHKAVIAGEVSPAGSGYILTARILTPHDRVALARFRETASGPDDLIPAIDRLSRSIRERVGESLRSLRAAAPLEQVTTSSLEALELYTRAIRALSSEGEVTRAAELLERAIERDTAFAMAHRKLNVALGRMLGSPTRRADALERAYRHRDRLGPRERGIVTGHYHNARGMPALARSAYEEVLADYPEDGTALNNLAVIYLRDRRWDDAIELFERATADRSGYGPHRNLVQTLFDAGRQEEAWDALQLMREQHPDNIMTQVVEMYLHSASGGHDAADSVALALASEHPGSPDAQGRSLFYRNLLDQLRGRLAAAEDGLQELWTYAADHGLSGTYHPWIELRRAEMHLVVRGDTAAAIQHLDEVLPTLFGDSVPPLDRLYLRAASLYAHAGAADRARSLLAEYEAVIPDSLRGSTRAVDVLIRGAEVDWGPALEHYREEAETGCLICAYDDLGRIHERLGRPDSAIAAYERYVHTPYHHRQDHDDHLALAFVLERLGDLHEQQRNHEKAAGYYARFVDLWADADPELQPRVRAARRALARLTSEGGS